MGQKPNLTASAVKIQVFCRPEWTNCETPRKLILEIFKCKKCRWAGWDDLSGFYVSLLSYGPDIVINCVPDVSKKSSAVIAIYVYGYGSICFTLLETGIDYFAIT